MKITSIDDLKKLLAYRNWEAAGDGWQSHPERFYLEACQQFRDRMMDKSINGRYGHYTICKDLIPVTKGMVGGDDHAFRLIAVSDKLKENMGLRLTLFDITNVV